MSPIMALHSMDQHVHASRLSLLRVRKLTAPVLVYAGVIGLTGCATSAEFESLRAEVAKTNATALRAEAEVARTQRELAALKAADKPPAVFSRPKTPAAATSTKPAGYKWGNIPPALE